MFYNWCAMAGRRDGYAKRDQWTGVIIVSSKWMVCGQAYEHFNLIDFVNVMGGLTWSWWVYWAVSLICHDWINGRFGFDKGNEWNEIDRWVFVTNMMDFIRFVGVIIFLRVRVVVECELGATHFFFFYIEVSWKSTNLGSSFTIIYNFIGVYHTSLWGYLKFANRIFFFDIYIPHQFPK